MSPPPGLVYLSKQLPQVLAPPLAVFCAKLVAEHRLGFYRDYQDRRQAAAHGAIMSPSVPGYIGGIHMLFMNNEMYLGEPLVAAAESIGYTMAWCFLFQNRMMTAEPDNIKAILATEFNSFEKGSEFRVMMEPLLGTGVFAADGKVSSSLICTVTDVFLETTCGRLPYPYHVSTDTSKSPAAAAQPSSAFATAFREAKTITALRSRFGEHWPLSKFWVDRLEEPMSVVHGFFDPILEEAVAKKRAMPADMQESNKKMNESGDRQVEGESLLDHLINYRRR
ncbi:hypothetical protein C8J57DRAFT_1706341 [Mycena rebaudengoi]|nr:hypothetical protein C8J57DRAFT_1706341 [Mycena rebaudengoi]